MNLHSFFYKYRNNGVVDLTYKPDDLKCTFYVRTAQRDEIETLVKNILPQTLTYTVVGVSHPVYYCQ